MTKVIKILIVEDDLDTSSALIKVYKKIFEEKDCNVSITNHTEGYRALIDIEDGKKYDLISLDMNLGSTALLSQNGRLLGSDGRSILKLAYKKQATNGLIIVSGIQNDQEIDWRDEEEGDISIFKRTIHSILSDLYPGKNVIFYKGQSIDDTVDDILKYKNKIVAASGLSDEPKYGFYKTGEIFHINFYNEVTKRIETLELKKTTGLEYIQRMIEVPNKVFKVYDLLKVRDEMHLKNLELFNDDKNKDYNYDILDPIDEIADLKENISHIERKLPSIDDVTIDYKELVKSYIVELKNLYQFLISSKYEKDIIVSTYRKIINWQIRLNEIELGELFPIPKENDPIYIPHITNIYYCGIELLKLYEKKYQFSKEEDIIDKIQKLNNILEKYSHLSQTRKNIKPIGIEKYLNRTEKSRYSKDKSNVQNSIKNSLIKIYKMKKQAPGLANHLLSSFGFSEVYSNRYKRKIKKVKNPFEYKPEKSEIIWITKKPI